MSAITTAVIVGVAAAGASAGATVYAANKSSNAAKNAAKTQSDAANTALGVQKSQYEQSRQDFSPYQQAGASSVGQLQQRAGQQTPQFNPGAQPQWGNLGNPQGGQMPPRMQPQGPPMGGQPMPPQGGMAPQGQPGMGGPMGQQQAPQKMVVLRAPDGTTHPFPQDKVQQVIQAAQAKGHQLQVVG